MKISDKYMICEIVGETYIVPRDFDKKDMSKVKKLTESATEILQEVVRGVDSLEQLQRRICDSYEAEDSERGAIEQSVAVFVKQCMQEGYLYG